MSFHAKLMAVLRTDPRFVDKDGELIVAAVQDHAWRHDHGLVKLLLTDRETKGKFFDEIDGHQVFDLNTFIAYVTEKNFLDNSYTRFRNRIGLTAGGKYLHERGDVALVWPHKDCVLEGGQTKDEKGRREVFFNEVLAQDEISRLLAPKVLTGFTRFTATGRRRSCEFRRDQSGLIRDNLILKGNNLLGLHVLKANFRRRIKAIYIDPPYNPDSSANTFAYNNNFNHSTWLTFMKNRLEVAKDLLTEDGVLIVAIDENEQAYLGVLLKEMFERHETHCITIVHNPRGVQGANFSYTHEYAFFVIPKGRKSIGNRRIEKGEITWSPLRNWGGESRREDARNCFYPVIVEKGAIVGFGDVVDADEHPVSQTVETGKQWYVYPIDQNGVERKWRYARHTVEDIKHLLRAKEVDGGYEIEIGKDFRTYKTVWSDKRYDANAYGTQLVKSLVPGCTFDFPKSLWNVHDCLHAVVGNDKQAIVLDFFAGSGTTAHAVIELNRDGGDRKFILCEQMDYVQSVTVERVRAVLEAEKQGDFVFCEMMKHNQAFMERIESARSSEELVEVWRNMAEGSFLNWYVNPKVPDDALKDFAAIGQMEGGLAEQKRLLAELLDKNQLYVSLSEIDDPRFGVSDNDKALNRAFYGEASNA